MKMNNERNKERFDSAMSKRGTNTKVLEDLAKPEWREQCEAIVEEIYDVSSTKEFESATNCRRYLTLFLNSLLPLALTSSSYGLMILLTERTLPTLKS